MKDEKKRAGRNAFPMFPFRADKEGQMEHWQAFAKKKGWTLSRLIREALDKYTGRKD